MVSKIAVQNLLAIVAAYRRATGKSMTAVSKKFYGNTTFFNDLKAGTRSVSVDKLDEMLEAFRAGWPEGAEWPAVRAIHMGRRPAAE